jgi:hypothetical protein
MVNRLWHHMMGRGIVTSVDDFGVQGELPTHPELLDWLTSDFMDRAWSVKSVLSQIALSQTYRQACTAHPALDPNLLAEADPSNRLWHRMPVRKLPAESIRDAILAVSGRLDPTPYGPPVPVHFTPFMAGRGAREGGPLDGNGRRTIYLSVYRNFLDPFLLVFDMPTPFGTQGRRNQSNVPAQALALMNDPFVSEQARYWAKRKIALAKTNRERVVEMVHEAHGVLPSPQQAQELEQFVDKQLELNGGDALEAWADLAHALINMKAFYFLR